MILSSRVLGGLDRGVNQPVGFMGKIPDPSVRKVVREEIFKQVKLRGRCGLTFSCVRENLQCPKAILIAGSTDLANDAMERPGEEERHYGQASAPTNSAPWQPNKTLPQREAHRNARCHTNHCKTRQPRTTTCASLPTITCVPVSHTATALPPCACLPLLLRGAALARERFPHRSRKAHAAPEITWCGWRILVEQLDTEYICPASTSDLSTGSCVSESSERDLRPGTDADARIDGSLGSVPRLFPRSLCLAGQATLFMAIVPTAMQVGLATESLGHNQAFRSASYGFTGFSVLRGLIAGPVIVLQFCATFLWNWMKALHRKGTPYSGVRSV
ncbi:hypothetical protein ARSEF1564_009834 [Beauveria bassiana]